MSDIVLLLESIYYVTIWISVTIVIVVISLPLFF